MKSAVNVVKAAALSAVVWGQAYAGMPVVAPAQGTQANSGDYLGVAKAYIAAGLMLVGLVLVAWGLVRVVSNLMSTYAEISDGKGTWADLVKHGIAGAVLATVAIFLVNQMNSLFS